MGTLHSVYQLKPTVINYGAVLRVRKDKEMLFSEKYGVAKTFTIGNELKIFENTFVTNAPDGKVSILRLYINDKITDFKEPGIYVHLQSGSKHGFESDFNAFLNTMASYLEDAIFYVIPEDIIYRYAITDGILSLKGPVNFDRWEYDFGAYLEENYADSKQLLAGFYIEQVEDLKLYHIQMIKSGDKPNEFFDRDEYETLLDSLSNYSSIIVPEEFKALEDWLKIQIASYD